MITRADLHTRFVKSPEGVLVHVPLEGVFLIPTDDLPEMMIFAAEALQANSMARALQDRKSQPLE